MEAKRAARAAARGFDLASINTQLSEFVGQQLDVLVGGHAWVWVGGWFGGGSEGRGEVRQAAGGICSRRGRHTPSRARARGHPPPLQAIGPLAKTECKAVQRLAALYGCRATLQGGSTKRKLVMVRGGWEGFGALPPPPPAP